MDKITPDKNVLLFMEKRTKELEDSIALGIRSHLGWKELTFKGVSILSKSLANYLMEFGIDRGDKVAILSESMPEWGAALFASVLSGATTIPLDIKLTTYELTSILSDCQPRVMLVSSSFLDTAEKLKEKIPSIEKIVLIDDKGANTNYPSIYTLADAPERKWRHRSGKSTAFIIYTSGTTGNPKGVEISFKNVISQVEAVSSCFDLGPNDNLLSILPMNHLFELTVGFLSFLSLGTSIYYSKSLNPKDLFPIFVSKKITFMVVVPAFLKLLKNSIEAEIHKMSKFRQLRFKVFYALAQFINSKTIKRLMFRDIHKKFGGHFKGFISGGAPLDINVGMFFENIGLKVYEGYGLSEASPVVAVNTEKNHKMGTVGKPLFNVQVKIDPQTEELLVKGENVMKGYYNRPEMTQSVMTSDGWLRTGDKADIDKDGFIKITGRLKNMIVLSGGKKVFPEEVESVLEQSTMFQEVCVVGVKRENGQKDGCEDVCAVIVPKKDICEKYPEDKDLEKAVKAEVKVLSQQLSHFKRPNNIVVRREVLPRTATSKIKRKEVVALVKC
ncbi:MAG: AMP-binding protein [Clostridiaceae bacterium]|jgi:long-chain acyl-CoA synthetase|nr:AMP-binding protein [Clostridiaceae bacterium]